VRAVDLTSRTKNVTTVVGLGYESLDFATFHPETNLINDAWDVALGLREEYLVVAEQGGESEFGAAKRGNLDCTESELGLFRE